MCYIYIISFCFQTILQVQLSFPFLFIFFFTRLFLCEAKSGPDGTVLAVHAASRQGM